MNVHIFYVMIILGLCLLPMAFFLSEARGKTTAFLVYASLGTCLFIFGSMGVFVYQDIHYDSVKVIKKHECIIRNVRKRNMKDSLGISLIEERCQDDNSY